MGFICGVGAQLPHAHSHRAGPGGKSPEHLKALPLLTPRTPPPRADGSVTPPCRWSPVSPDLPDPDETLVAASRIAAVESGCLPLATAAPVFWGIFLSWFSSFPVLFPPLSPSPSPSPPSPPTHSPTPASHASLSWASPTPGKPPPPLRRERPGSLLASLPPAWGIWGFQAGLAPGFPSLTFPLQIHRHLGKTTLR